MSEQPTDYGRFAAISEQTPQFESLLYLARTFPGLPPAYVTGNSFAGLGVSLRVETATEAEAWRVALLVPGSDVILRRYSDYTTIEFVTAVHGVPVAVYAATPLGPQLAAVSPAEDAERRAAALVEQRHQVEDPAVPPPGFAEPVSTAALDLFAEDAAPTAPIAVRTLADAQGGIA